MTPKEKAKELINSFRDYAHGYHDENETYNAKKCTLICVDEILETYLSNLTRKHWEAVKNEIEKL